jgi:hypothetical protein
MVNGVCSSHDEVCVLLGSFFIIFNYLVLEPFQHES